MLRWPKDSAKVSARQKGKANGPRLEGRNVGRKEVEVCNNNRWSRKCWWQNLWHRHGRRKVKVFSERSQGHSERRGAVEGRA